MKPQGLRTKLIFRFLLDDEEPPELTFESKDIEPEEKTEIKIVSKKKSRTKDIKRLF